MRHTFVEESQKLKYIYQMQSCDVHLERLCLLFKVKKWTYAETVDWISRVVYEFYVVK